MKKLKNVMLLIACGLVVTTLVTTSCKKDDGGSSTPVPTISSFSPLTAAVGATVTITGTNLTGATIVKFGTIAATSFTVVSATSITCVVPAGAAGAISVTTPGGTATSAASFSIASALSSNDVAAANLIAHWTFDANNKEGVSNTSASTESGVTYSAAGKIGNCATFANGYLVYPEIHNINYDTALQSYSISMWVKMPTHAAADPLKSLFQITGTKFSDLWGNVAFELSNNGVVGDSLPLQARQVQVDGLAPYVHNQTAGPSNFGTGGSANWTFITQTYNGNGANQTMKLYANGNLINTVELTTVDKSITSTQSTFRIVPTGNYPTDGFVPSNKVYIGTMSFKDRGNTVGDGYGNFAPNAADRPWAGASITGAIDDIRLFNKALSATEVTDLFTRGSAGN